MKNRVAERLIGEDKGYSLLALIIALAMLAIVLASSVSTFHAETMREKEEEFIFRGEEVAKAIARFNNTGRLGQLHIGLFPSKLEDLAKQTNVNGQKLIYLRKFALTDPLTNGKWRPVRAGDPLIAEYLQNWSAYNQTIPFNDQSFYQVLIGGGASGLPKAGVSNGNNSDDDDDEDDDDDDEPAPSQQGKSPQGAPLSNAPQQPGGYAIPNPQIPQPQQDGGSASTGGASSTTNSSDEDQRIIVGVVSRSKGKAYRRLLGKDVTYDKWLFIYIPVQQNQPGFIIPPQNPGLGQPGQPPQTGQPGQPGGNNNPNNQNNPNNNPGNNPD